MQRPTPAGAPIRKQLVKKIVSYYDTLERERVSSRSRSPSKLKKKASVLSPKRKRKSKQKKKRTKKQPQRGGQAKTVVYRSDLHQNAKLSKLEELMKTELVRGEIDDSIRKKDSFKQSDGSGSHDSRVPTRGEKTRELQQEEVEFEELVYKTLQEKVKEADQNPIPPSDCEDIQSEYYPDGIPLDQELPIVGANSRDKNMFYDRLYHLNTKKNYIVQSGADADNYDFHQRKSKEIRRLQYSAGLVKPKKQKVKICRYRVWVVHDRNPYPADFKIRIPGGDKSKDLLEVKEGDSVDVEVLDIEGEEDGAVEGFVVEGLPKQIKGVSSAPVVDDGDCDLVAITKEGIRWPVMLDFREIPPPTPPKVPTPVQEVARPPTPEAPAPPTREVVDTNSKVFGPDGASRGRARFDLFDGEDSIVFGRGFLINNDNKLEQVLIKRISKTELLIKPQGQPKIVERVEIEQAMYYSDCSVTLTVLTLRQRPRPALPRQVYFIEGMETLEDVKLIEGVPGVAVCVDTFDYQGSVEYENGKGLKLNLDSEPDDKNDGFVTVVLDKNLRGTGFFDVADLEDRIYRHTRFRKGGPWCYCDDEEKKPWAPETLPAAIQQEVEDPNLDATARIKQAIQELVDKTELVEESHIELQQQHEEKEEEDTGSPEEGRDRTLGSVQPNQFEEQHHTLQSVKLNQTQGGPADLQELRRHQPDVDGVTTEVVGGVIVKTRTNKNENEDADEGVVGGDDEDHQEVAKLQSQLLNGDQGEEDQEEAGGEEEGDEGQDEVDDQQEEQPKKVASSFFY